MGVLCFIALGRGRLPDSYLLAAKEVQERERIVSIARSELGIREATGRNDGKRVEEYLSVCGLPKGHPWCAAFVSWVFKQAGFAHPRTAWSPAMFNTSVNVKQARPAVVFGLYFDHLKRIGHVGLVERAEGDWLVTIEGNTNISGSREGDGVYRKRRHRKTVYRYADWAGKEAGL